MMSAKTEAVSALDAVPVSTDIQAKHRTEGREFQGIPGVVITPKGRLWACWYSGGKGEGPDNFNLLVTSTDGGTTWSEPVAVVDPGGNVRAYDPVLWIDPLGRLWFFWAQCASLKINNVFDGVAGVWGACASDLESDCPTWTAPVRIANGVMMNKPTVLSNGHWAMPTALWKDLAGGTVPEHLHHERLANMTISKDNGETFQWVGGMDVPERCFDEHMIVELAGGKLWMLVRTNYGIGHGVSEDGGKTWSTPEDSGIGGPNSRFFIRRLKSGSLLLVNHDVSGDESESGDWRKRAMLTAWVSRNDGQSWDGGLLLDEREGVSYPDGMEDEDGNIVIIYDHERYKQGNILLARFREEEVLTKALSAPGSFLKRLVNKTGGLKEQ